jgi:restriction system protein
VSVVVVENTGTFETDDGATVWCGGYVPVAEDGNRLSVAEHRTTDPRCFFCAVAGSSFRRDALQSDGLRPGANVALRPEPNNEHDPNAIGVWDLSTNRQLGYIPRELSPVLEAQVPPDGSLAETLGAVVISEYRKGSEQGLRVGLHILVGPVGNVELEVRSAHDCDESPGFVEAVDSFKERNTSAVSTPGVASVVCPACGSTQQAFAGVGGFRCTACQRDVWIINCRRCHKACRFFGSATGSGALSFKCGECGRRNIVEKQRLREISTQARRFAAAAASARRSAAAAAVVEERIRRAQHLETVQEEASRKTAEARATIEAMESLLARSISENTDVSFAMLKAHSEPPTFSPGVLLDSEPAPVLETFLPPPATGVAARLPGHRAKQQALVDDAHAAFEKARSLHSQRQQERLAALEKAKAEFQAGLEQAEEATRRQHEEIDELERRFSQGAADAVVDYLGAVISSITLPYDPPKEARVAFSPESSQLVLELELPKLDVIPNAREYRYVKARDEIAVTAMPATARKTLYTSLISQTALATIHLVFSADSHNVVDTVVLNGHVEAIDPRTGQTIHPCLLTVRTTRDRFAALNLQAVNPIECLKGLSASVSRSPSELVPVRPLIDFDMADPRFIQETDILSTLDTRPNLMELTPSEFEALITNLFERMGLETKLTQASRDGGVDCVAYDTRPIFGGKVVIQAKRYKNTVGVSAVRDLFGTMQNEGATKGILVATSGYGQASHEFANGKPLELIDGANLLYLLHEHANLDAKIEAPEDWVDPLPEG